MRLLARIAVRIGEVDERDQGRYNQRVPKGLVKSAISLIRPGGPRSRISWALDEHIRRLMTIPGMGEMPATKMLMDLPELGHLDNKNIAALV